MTTTPNEPTDGQHPQSDQPAGASSFSFDKPAGAPTDQPYGQQPQGYGQPQQGYGQPQGLDQPPYGTASYGSGSPAGYGAYAGAGHPSSGLAIGALAAGVVGLLLFWCVVAGVPLGIAAVVMGVVAMNKVKAGTGGGRGLALAGIITGGLAIPLSLVVTIAAIATGNADFSTSP